MVSQVHLTGQSWVLASFLLVLPLPRTCPYISVHVVGILTYSHFILEPLLLGLDLVLAESLISLENVFLMASSGNHQSLRMATPTRIICMCFNIFKEQYTQFLQ